LIIRGRKGGKKWVKQVLLFFLKVFTGTEKLFSKKGEGECHNTTIENKMAI